MAKPWPKPEEMTCFETPEAFHRWLSKNHGAKTELWMRQRKVGARVKGLVYAESLDLALCFGWIDGVRLGIDSNTYATRYTPRQKSSIWSHVNIRHYERLVRAGKMEAPGKAVFESRNPARTGLYSFENRPKELSPEYVRQFKKAPSAWKFFREQAPSYQRVACFWVMSAKKDETPESRLKKLIATSAAGRRA